MILNHNTQLKVMQVLAKYWYKEFSAYELAKASGITAPMAYQSINTLTKYNILTKHQAKVKINFKTHFAYQFKQLYDTERFALLPAETQQKINHIYQVLQAEYHHNLLAFLIFGSVASGETTENSDIDILTIVTKKKDIDYKKRGLFALGKINIIEKDEREWESDYTAGHDLILNALMNGIILHDGDIIRNFLQRPLPSPSSEAILQKKERLGILKDRLLLLLKDQDYGRLEEEFKQYLIEQGRIILLEEGIIPSSKKDLLIRMKKIAPKIYKTYHDVTPKNIKSVILQYV
ncbi:MAG: nucleotidyltransferase domain-containing protein [Nanoarchaeota archaeon]|nr:nucleotidyltransferase domain-containing protein [Nanoarchaeota archaeon]